MLGAMGVLLGGCFLYQVPLLQPGSVVKVGIVRGRLLSVEVVPGRWKASLGVPLYCMISELVPSFRHSGRVWHVAGLKYSDRGLV